MNPTLALKLVAGGALASSLPLDERPEQHRARSDHHGGEGDPERLDR